jgi:two-component sensor histidine kinase
LPLFAVSLRPTEGNSVTLSVTDDGAPLPVTGQQEPNGIGLNLVARLADQPAGALKVNIKPKCFTVVFPAHAYHQH